MLCLGGFELYSRCVPLKLGFFWFCFPLVPMNVCVANGQVQTVASMQ